MNILRSKLNDDNWYGVGWAEFFISLVLGSLVKFCLVPVVSYWILIPASWVLVHALLGKKLERFAKNDLPHWFAWFFAFLVMLWFVVIIFYLPY